MKLQIPTMVATNNKYSPWRRILEEKEVFVVRAYILRGCGDAKTYYEAFVDEKWQFFLKSEQKSPAKRKLPVIKQFKPIGILVRSGTASSSGYKHYSDEVAV